MLLRLHFDDEFVIRYRNASKKDDVVVERSGGRGVKFEPMQEKVPPARERLCLALVSHHDHFLNDICVSSQGRL